MDRVDHAARALTDPANLQPDQHPGAKMWAIDEERVLDALAVGGLDRLDARTVAVEALRRIGGELSRERLNRSRLRDGRVAVGREDYHEVWYVPVAAVRGAPQSSSGSSGAGPAEWDPVK